MCHICGSEKQKNWYFFLCEKHKQQYRQEKRNREKGLYCKNVGHSWSVSFYGGIKKERCKRCWQVKLPSYMHTAIDSKKNSYFLYKKLEKYNKRFLRKYRRFEEHYYSGKVANIIYWLRYEKKWSAERIESELGITSKMLNTIIITYPWRIGDKFLSDEQKMTWRSSKIRPVSLQVICSDCKKKKRKLIAYSTNDDVVLVCASCNMIRHKHKR